MHIIEENRTRQDLLQELSSLRSQLSVEKERRRMLSKKLARITIQELPESKKRFQMAAKAAKIGTYSRDLQTDRTYWSPEILAIFGLGPNDPLPLEEDIPAAVHPDDRQKVKMEAKASMNSVYEPEFISEHRIIRTDGKVRWVLVRGRVDFDSNGCPAEIHGVMADITQRKEAEAELGRLAQFPEENPNPILRCNPAGTILYSNPAARNWLKSLGWQSEKPLPDSILAALAKIPRQNHSITSEITNDQGRTFSISAIQPSGETYINLYGIDITERKKVEEAARHNEARFRQLANAMPQLVWTANPDGQIDYYNVRREEYRGIGQKVSGNFKWAPMLHPDDKQVTLESWKQSVLTGNIYQCEHRIQRLDGSYHWHLSRAIPVCDHNGSIIKWFGTATDIDNLKQAEAALRHSEQRYRSLFYNNHAAMLLIDPQNGQIIDTNPAACSFYGYGPDEITKLNIADINDLPIEEVHAQIQLAKTSKRRHFFFKHRLANGQVRNVEVFSGPIYMEGQELLYSIVHDITERKQTEEALLKEKNFSEALLDSLPGVFYLISESGRFLRWNRALEQVSGYSHDEIKLMCTQDFFKDKNSLIIKQLNQKNSNRGPFTVEADLVSKNGRKTPYFFTGLEFDYKKRRCIMGMGIDISARKQMEAARLELEHRMQQIAKAESLSRMAGAVAHHFNNMLGAVLGNLELAQKDLITQRDIRGYLAGAEQAARRAAWMSELMLSFLGQSQGQQETIDLSKICKENLSQLQVDIPDNINLETELPLPGPSIQADASRICQVLTNLTTNACEAIDSSPGTIQIKVEQVEAAAIEDTLRFPLDWAPSADKYARLSVTDTGRGIPTKTIHRIFDPFFTDKFTGRGLGLAVTLGNVKSFGGCITVHSSPGNGSTMRVYLPLSDKSVACPMEKDTAEPHLHRKEKIVLLVEDQRMVRQVATAMLERLGFEVFSAKDGAEALEIFQANQDRIRLVISDLTMPRMDGWETLTALRRLTPDMPVILVSGYDQSQVLTGNHDEQPQYFLHKPYRMETLKTAIEKVLEVGSGVLKREKKTIINR